MRTTLHPRDYPRRQGLTLLLAAAIRPPRVPIVRRAEVRAAAVAALTAAVEVELRMAVVAGVLPTAVVEAVLLIAAAEEALTVTVNRF